MGDVEVQMGLRVKCEEGAADTSHFFPSARSNLKYINWSLPQVVAHHASNGCPLSSGDLLGTGTISGSEVLTTSTKESHTWGCLMERNKGASRKVKLRSDDSDNRQISRYFLEDGDVCVMQAQTRCGRIHFGDCVGEVLPAHQKW